MEPRHRSDTRRPRPQHSHATAPGFSTFVVGADASDVSVTSASLAAETVAPGEPVDVSVTLENQGQYEGMHTVELLADGTVVATADVIVPADETETLTLSWTPESAGSYELAADEEPAGSLDVQEGAVTTATVTEAPDAGDPEPPLSDVALIALLLAVVVVGVALYVYRDRFV